MLRTVLASSVVALTLVAPPLVSAATPSVEKGWPQVAPGSSEVIPDVKGGVVLSGFHFIENDPLLSTLAYTQRGKRRWLVQESPACGNCDGDVVPTAQSDGTFGPVGFTGDDFWAVTGSGQRVQGCAGVVFTDGTCVANIPGPNSNVIRATRAGSTLWEYVEPNFSWVAEFNVPAPVVRDAAGTLYVTYGQGKDGAGATAPARLIALNPDGTFKWRKLNPAGQGFGWGQLQGALRSGVVITTPTGIAAVNGDGADLWSIDESSPSKVRAVTDPDHDRVYLLKGLTSSTRIDAIDAITGKKLWKTTTTSLADIGKDGTVYVADRFKNSSGAVRAIRMNGKLKWRFRTASHATDAAELTDGRVALSTVDDLVLRVNPKRAAPPVRRSNVALTRRVIKTACGGSGSPGSACATGAQWGTILRINLRRSSGVTVTIRGSGTRPVVKTTAPSGKSFLRLFAGKTFAQKGRNVLEVTWREGGRAKVRRFAVTVR